METVFEAGINSSLRNYLDKMTDYVTPLLVARIYFCLASQIIKKNTAELF